jgi:hypothetical protein
MDQNSNPELATKIAALMDDYLAKPTEERKQQLEGVVAIKEKLELEQRNAEGKKEKITIGKLTVYDKPMKNVKVLRNLYDDDGKPVIDTLTGKQRTRLDDGWVLTGSIESIGDPNALQRYAIIEKYNDLGQHLVRVVSMKEFTDMNLAVDNITPADIDRYRSSYMNARWLGTTGANSTAEYLDEVIARVSQLDGAPMSSPEPIPVAPDSTAIPPANP